MSLTALLGLYIAVKITIIFLLGARLRSFFGAWPLSLAASWLILHIGLIGWLLGLSAVHAVSGGAVWTFLGGGLLGLIATAPPEDFDRHHFSIIIEHPFYSILLGGFVAVVFGFLFYRTLYFFDTTWDALVYEMPRVSFYAQARSLFVTYPTEGLNIFSNEWNGELLALLSRLASGSDQAAGLGGTEIWAWSILALFAAAHRMGASLITAALIALVLMTTPAAMGLAMVVKGDLLAAVGLCFGVACMLRANGDDEVGLLVAAIMSLALGAGAKISVLPVSALLVAYAGWRLAQKRSARPLLFWVGLAGAIATSRYIANLIIYHNPVERVAYERAEPGWATVWGNLWGLLNKWFDLVSWPWAPPSNRLALGFGLGGAGWLALLAFSAAWLTRKAKWPAQRAISLSVIALLFVAWIHLAWNVPWRDWAFRYYFPWILTAAFLLLVIGLRWIPPRPVRATGAALLLTAAIQVSYSSGQGEVIPSDFATARTRSQLERKVAFNIYMATPSLQAFASSPPKRVVIFNRLNSVIFPFFGDDSRHQVRLVDSIEDLIASARNGTDALVLSGEAPPELNAISTKMKTAGFEVYLSSPFFTLWTKKSQSLASGRP